MKTTRSGKGSRFHAGIEGRLIGVKYRGDVLLFAQKPRAIASACGDTLEEMRRIKYLLYDACVHAYGEWGKCDGMMMDPGTVLQRSGATSSFDVRAQPSASCRRWRGMRWLKCVNALAQRALINAAIFALAAGDIVRFRTG
jgi:hypothetical protein